jgi:xanthine dehydrogenase YagS FAD-binding subunit
MHPFSYLRADDETTAVTACSHPDAAFLAGGTTLVDLLRLEIMRPAAIVDITGLPLDTITEDKTGGGLTIGAMVRNSDLAEHPLVQKRYPVLSEALLSGASPQLRNMATVGGNLLQRTRCPYFRDAGIAACNKRTPGAGCAAIDGFTRSHAILGTSDACIATNPSDMNVALAALDAKIHVRGSSGERTIAFGDLHVQPGGHPEVEHSLAPGELITSVTLPALPAAARSTYIKVRDRASFAFALASAAVALDIAGKTIREARVALGGVATVPWRAREAESLLAGRTLTVDNFQRAATAALAGAKPRGENAFKIELAKRTLVRALQKVGGVV